MKQIGTFLRTHVVRAVLAVQLLSTTIPVHPTAAKLEAQESARDSLTEKRAATFILKLAGDLPRLAAMRYAPAFAGRWDVPTTPEREIQLRRLFALGGPWLHDEVRREWPRSWHYPDVDLQPLQWLDSLRVLWPQTDDMLRADVLFYSHNELHIITPVLLELAAQRVALQSVQQFALAALKTAQHEAIHTQSGDEVSAIGHLLTGAVALAQGDTTRAVSALLRAACMQMLASEVAMASGPAARMLAQVAEERRDTTQWLMALTVQRLRQPMSWLNAGSMVVDARLREVYARYVTAHGTPPDVVPHRLDGEPVPGHSLDYDAYLDRQWSALYDRGFPVDSAPAAGVHSTRRLVVVEYGTSIGCGGCYHDDRILGGVPRRYASDDVMLLTYNYGHPVVNDNNDLMDQYWKWYPNPYSRTQSRIPLRTLVTAAGDTLKSLIFVNGRGVSQGERPARPDLPAWYNQYQRVVQRIDEELQRRPDARVRVDAIPRGDRIIAQVHIDSLRGQHHELALRLGLVEDTVWVHSGTLRRIYQNVVRAAALADSSSIGLPLPTQTSATIQYTFDLAAIQAGILAPRDADAMRRTRSYLDRQRADEDRDVHIARFQDPRDWQLNRSRLSVVAFVQDLETGEVLQAARVKVPGGPSGAF